MNAVKFLINEHNRFRKFLVDIDDPAHRHPTKLKLFNQLCTDLIRHETMEQAIWYPRLKTNEKANSVINHLVTEEKNAEKTIKEFSSLIAEEEWETKFQQLKKDVSHHADEEEKQLFPLAQTILNDAELEEIGKQMDEFKNQINAQN